jgi:hypothetical protein
LFKWIDSTLPAIERKIADAIWIQVWQTAAIKKMLAPKISLALPFWHTKNSITSFVYHSGIMILSNSSKGKGREMR